MAESTELVVFAWGNSARGDDGAGPEIAQRLRGLDAPGVTVIEDMQLQIEHVADMASDVPVLFVDASVAIVEGFAFERIFASRDPSVTTHAVSPQALLQLYESTMGQPAPNAWQLHIAARDFELGEQASALTASATLAAFRFLEELLAAPSATWTDTLDASSAATRASA